MPQIIFKPRPAATRPAKPKRQPTPEQLEAAQHLAWDAIQDAIYTAILAAPAHVPADSPLHKLTMQFVAVNATNNDFPGCDRVAALAAAVEFGTPKQCRTLLAARYLGFEHGNEWHEDGAHFFETRSVGHVGDFRRVKWLGGDSFQCGCEALSECWHIKSARNVATLMGFYGAPVTIDNMTDAAHDADDDLQDAAPVRAAVAAYPGIDEDLSDVSGFIKRPGTFETTPHGGTFTDYGPPVESKPVKNAAVVRPGWAQQPATVDYCALFED